MKGTNPMFKIPIEVIKVVKEVVKVIVGGK